MLPSAKQLRNAGARDLKGRWSEAAMFTFVYIIIAGLVSCTVTAGTDLFVPGLGTGIFGILLIPMGWGYSMTFLANHRKENNDPFDISHLLDGYRDFLRILTTEFLHALYVLLWSLLLIIPGFIKSLSYAMTPFILRDYPELKNNAAIELSMKMMDGKKVDLFWLYLTFIGWGIVCILTLGIGYFWVEPYVTSTMANFYEEVKKDYQMGGVDDAEIIEEKTTDNYQK